MPDGARASLKRNSPSARGSSARLRARFSTWNVAPPSGARSRAAMARGSNSWPRLRTSPAGTKALFMIIGVPKEIKAQENRVGMLPSSVYQLSKHGHTVLVEKSAGVGTGHADEDYTRAG